MKKIQLCLAFFFVSSVLFAANLRNAKVKEIIDGNTFVVRVQNNLSPVVFNAGSAKPKIVHLYGIYTPPEFTIIMEKARAFLTDKILDKKVTVYVEEKIDKNNVSGRVKAPSIRDVGRALVKLGLAKNKGGNAKYAKEEEKAKRKKIGMWADKYQNTNDNAYAQASAGANWQYYKLKLSGYDAFYKIGTGPNKYLVYHKNRGGKVLSQYVIVGINPHKLDMLRNNETDIVIVQAIGKQGIRFPSGNIKYFPKLKVVGKSKVYGVGGELMYYK